MNLTNIAFSVCPITDVPNRKGKGFSLLRRGADGIDSPLHIIVLRWDRRIFAYVNSCPHQKSRLDWEEGVFTDPNSPHLICGKHGADFTIDTGTCVSGPCKGRDLQQLQVTVIEGDVCLLGLELVDDA